jgi:transcriptional regulator with XRE-family HTH domain
VLPFRVSIGLRIEELRDSLNLNRRQLADRIPGIPGIDERQIIDYERHEVVPNPENMERLALALEVKVRDVYDFDDERVRATVPLEVRLANRAYRSDRGVTRRKAKDPDPKNSLDPGDGAKPDPTDDPDVQ